MNSQVVSSYKDLQYVPEEIVTDMYHQGDLYAGTYIKYMIEKGKEKQEKKETNESSMDDILDRKKRINDTINEQINQETEDEEERKELKEFVDELLSGFVDGYLDIMEMVDGIPSDNEPDTESEDIVNHPNHYTDGPIECFDLIRAMEGEERAAGFAIGNVWKYLYRHNKKGHDLEDIRKAIKYAKFYLDIMENV